MFEEALPLKEHCAVKKDPLASFPYIHDKTTGLFHVKGCPKCSKDIAQLQGFGTLKGCMKKHLRPCACCKEEAEQYYRKKGIMPKGYFYSVRSSRKLVHFPGCSILEKVSPYNIRSFDTLSEAWNHGYCVCQKCSLLKRMYQAEMTEICQFCTTHPMTISLESDGIHVISKNDFWRIIIEEYHGNPVLYHRNRNINCRDDTSGIPSYHKQKTSATTLMEHLRYIARHDAYRNHEENAPNQNGRNDKRGNPSRRSKNGQHLRKKQKNKQRRKKIGRVLTLIEELSASHH